MTILRKQRLGTCYYPEHWPRERWETDAALMAEAGISHVRIGEFAWSRLEPEPGRYDFGWMDEAFDVLGAQGLRIVLGTPTATPPKWLVDTMPDMVALDDRGDPRRFGSRRHYCFSHQGYRAECARIAEALARRYGTHDALEAWQIDNEYGCHDTVMSYSRAALDGFRNWLAQKYQSPDALNRAWGNVFWSKEYSSFDAIDLPNLTVTEPNPAHVMDFWRYSSDQVVAFNRLQADIIRRHSPGRAVSHNFMGSEIAFDHYAVGADLDIATWDSYPLGFLDRDTSDEAVKLRYLGVGDPDLQAFHHDLYRACGQVRNGQSEGRWWVMEQQPGPVNWAPFNPAPEPGALRLWAFEAFAAGAEIVSYFRWRQPSFAQEQMHEALLLPNGDRNEGWHVCKKVAGELNAFGAVAAPERADVALVFDYESAWAWAIQPQGADFSHLDMALRFYRALRRAGVSVDVVPPTPQAVQGRKLVVLPSVYAGSAALANALSGGDTHLIVGPRTGSKTRDFQIHPNLPPGPFGALTGVTVTRVESRPPFAPVALDNGTMFEGWREFVRHGDDVTVQARCADGHPAHLVKGRVHYLAGRPDARLADSVVRRVLADAGIAPLDLHRDVRIRDNGAIRYLFNYGPEPVDVSPWTGKGDALLGETPLEPRGVMAVRRA